MSLAKLKKELKQQSKEEIIELILDLYKKVPPAKDFLNVYTSYDTENLIEKYKKEIGRLVIPKGWEMKMNEVEARKLIRTIRKMKIDKVTIASELHYVECCLDVVEQYGIWNEIYYVAIEKMFDEAEKRILTNGWENEYRDYLNQLIKKANQFGMLEY
ncbi:MAG: DUF6155 family protein [Moheibacter sp.]